MRRGLLIPTVFTAVSLVILLALGGWQWARKGEKEALLATIRARISDAPQPFLPVARWGEIAVADAAYRPVSLAGSFDHARELHVFFALAKPVNGIGGPGYLIITPFMLDGGGTVLVNRGFVPVDRKAPQSRQAGQISGQLTITGLMRAPETRTMFSGADDPVKNVYFVRDPARLAAQGGLGTVAPVMVDLMTPVPQGGLPLPAQTQIDIPNNHFSYALTWWSLAASLAVIFLIYARARRD